MGTEFELKTRRQFSNLIAKRDSWNQRRDPPRDALPYDQLVGSYWARHNCALEEPEQASSWRLEVLEGERERQLEFHLQASRWFLERTKQEALLASSDLLHLHSLIMGQATPQVANYRQSPASPLVEDHDPAEWEWVPDLVENSLEWFYAGSFGEMHEVEKTALMLLKLTDIQPFDHHNGKTLRLFSNFFLLKAGYPPAVIRSDQAGRYALAIRNALRFQTGQLVELLADSVVQSLGLCLGETVTPVAFRGFGLKLS